MNCGTRNHRGQGCHGPVHACGCGGHAWRRFQGREERVGRLERYLEDLQKEAQAVEERIAALQAE